MSEVYHSPGYSPVYISRSTDPRTVMVWGAYDAENRYKAETRVHCALKAYRVSPELKLGREVYAAPLPLVLRVLEQEVSGMVEMFAWNIDPYVFGYPIPKRHTSGGDAT